MNKAEESAIIEYIKEKPEFLESISDAIKDICLYMGQILSDEKFMEELKKSANKQDTAEWIRVREGIKVTEYKCSKCGRVVRDDTGYDVAEDYPYCHCGAKMKGDK